MNRVQDEQRRRNEISRNCWQLYASHRRNVTRFLLDNGTSDHGSLCVLGAGNCNDLDLGQLMKRFPEIHLVDLDPLAMEQAARAQGPFAAGQLRLHPGTDVTGLADWLSRWTPQTPPDTVAVDEVISEIVNSTPFTLEPPVDMAASICLLSQIIDSIALAIGPEHPRFLPLVAAVRAAHLRTTAELVRPGGRLVMITDFNNSDAWTGLASITDAELPELAAKLINDHNFFTGLNPFLLHSLFQSDPWLSRHTEQARLSRPWRWTFPTRTYVVCAICAVKRVN